ncbi:MAG: hypothetical protein B7Z13_03270 [Caulobacterales bacterium 32-67-6]|nr:MAG: hypothetical protein B7Z13_03270 [Caulobacterales bacterium 32-67-6]
MSVAYHDRGLLLGDGLFETLLAVDGRPADWDAHMARLALGCAALGLPAPAETQARVAAQAALASAGLETGRAALRITWTAGSGGRGLDRPEACAPVLFATAAPAPAPGGPLRLITAATRRNAGSVVSRHKTLSYLDNVLARREATMAGADDLFWVSEGRLVTPALECGVLAGVTRAKVLAWARDAGVPMREAALGPEALGAAQAVFVTNSLTGARPARSLDGQPLNEWPLMESLSAALI